MRAGVVARQLSTAPSRRRQARTWLFRQGRKTTVGCLQPKTSHGFFSVYFRRLSDGGPDHPRWVAAICPNCHRHIHHGEAGPKLNEELAGKIGALEMSVG